MPWLWIFKLFQSKIGKVLFGFIKNKELRNWLKKGLFNKDLFERGFDKNLFGKKVKRSAKHRQKI